MAPAHFAPNFWDHPKKSQEFLDEIFHRKNSGIFWDGSQKIPKDPKFFGVIWGESQKNWDHPKKLGSFWDGLGEIHEGPKQSHGSKKKHLYTSP